MWVRIPPTLLQHVAKIPGQANPVGKRGALLGTFPILAGNVTGSNPVMLIKYIRAWESLANPRALGA